MDTPVNIVPACLCRSAGILSIKTHTPGRCSSVRQPAAALTPPGVVAKPWQHGDVGEPVFTLLLQRCNLNE
jgi:hypothetical protein